MEKVEKYQSFLRDYREYVQNIIKPTRNEIKIILDRWREVDYWRGYSTNSHLPSPSLVQRIFVRIKRPESVVDKITRKPEAFPSGLAPASFNTMNDVVGARVVVYFMSQLPIIDGELQKKKEIEVSTEYPPTAYLKEDIYNRLGLTHLKRQDKESGYASIHYLVKLKESSVPKGDRPWIELQIRTLAEDLWGEVEHILGYKPNKRTSLAVTKQFQIISLHLAAIDEHFNFIYEELLRFQQEVKIMDTDPLNAENFPTILSEVGIGCSQREVDSLLKVLVSRGVSTVGGLKKLATNRRLDIIRNTYRSILQREPINFEIVATLATLAGVTNDEEELILIRTQIDYLEIWDQIKKNLKH